LKIIDRYIIKLLIPYFIVGFISFSILVGLEPLVKALYYFFKSKVDLYTALKFFMFKTTDGMFYAFPLSMLLASLLLFSRLSQTGEYIAIVSSGVPFKRVAAPVVIFSILISLIAGYFIAKVVPPSLNKAKQIENKKIKGILYDEYVFNLFLRNSTNEIVYIRRFSMRTNDGDDFMLVKLKNHMLVTKICAKKASYVGSGIWQLKRVFIYKYRPGKLREISTLTMPTMELNLSIKLKEFKSLKKRLRYLTNSEILAKIKLIRERGLGLALDLLTEYYSRFALAASPLIFALLGVALGITNKRSSAGVSFGMCLFIMFTYYVANSIFKTFGKEGVIPPLLAAWAANFVFISIITYLHSKVTT